MTGGKGIRLGCVAIQHSQPMTLQPGARHSTLRHDACAHYTALAAPTTRRWQRPRHGAGSAHDTALAAPTTRPWQRPRHDTGSPHDTAPCACDTAEATATTRPQQPATWHARGRLGAPVRTWVGWLGQQAVHLVPPAFFGLSIVSESLFGHCS